MISIKNVWKSFGKLEVLKGVNLEVAEGETLVILGRSGTGKSVLLKQILGLQKPDQGQVIVDNKEISALPEKELLSAIKGMGMLFQSGALFDSMTIKENTEFYLKQNGDPDTGKIPSDEEMDQRVKKVLSQVGLEDVENKFPTALSGGMRKRAAFARLIAYHPKIILYDEPTTGLDPITSLQIAELIIQIQKESNATSIVVTHDIPVALRVANRIALHNEGKIAVCTNKADFIKSNHPLVQEFLKYSFANPSSLVEDNS